MSFPDNDEAGQGADVFAALGWDPGWEQEFSDRSGTPGRVTRVDRGVLHVLTRAGPVLAPPAADVPAVVTGDWVALNAGDLVQVSALVARRTALVRRDPGEEPAPQLLATNMDQVWIVHAVEQPLRAAWLDRALAMAHGSGATPVVVLTKIDQVTDAGELCERIATLAPGVATAATSATGHHGLQPLITRLHNGRTAALLGRSGSGKSSLVNALAGAAQRTAAVRVGDARGRHTTTRRALVLTAGGSVIDTPGIRALGLWKPAKGLALTFPDIAELATHCRFDDCRHRDEPGCEVRSAVKEGRLPSDRYGRFITLSSF